MLPILRWAGSKRKLIPLLKRYWQPYHQRYCEPFAGSACLFFAIEPNRALISDLNPELIDSYKAIRDFPLEVFKHLEGKENDPAVYYSMRNQNTDLLTCVEQAARFVYLNRFCFNGLYRTNLTGQFNVPYGGNGSGQLPTLADITAVSHLLKHCVLRCQDFSKTIASARKGDLVYLDPPYRVESRRTFREYNPAVFSTNDLKRLRNDMESLDRRGIDFVVSYADTDEAEELGRGYLISRVKVRRNIAGFVKHRGVSSEVMITNMNGIV